MWESEVILSRFRVLVDDNFHYMCEEERYEHDVFDSVEDAIAACRRIVDGDLEGYLKHGVTADKLCEMWFLFGSDPFIVPLEGPDGQERFSADDYVRERSKVLAGTSAG